MNKIYRVKCLNPTAKRALFLVEAKEVVRNDSFIESIRGPYIMTSYNGKKQPKIIIPSGLFRVKSYSFRPLKRKKDLISG